MLHEVIDDDEMREAIEHEDLGELANNPGGDWMDEAMSALGLDVREFDDMDDDQRTLIEFRVWRRAWELRNADEAKQDA